MYVGITNTPVVKIIGITPA
jgi:hypothetical protein